MIVDIAQARYLDEYRIWLKFNAGETGVVDLRDLIFKYPAAEPLRKLEEFQRFYLDSWPTLAWDSGWQNNSGSRHQSRNRHRGMARNSPGTGPPDSGTSWKFNVY